MTAIQVASHLDGDTGLPCLQILLRERRRRLQAFHGGTLFCPRARMRAPVGGSPAGDALAVVSTAERMNGLHWAASRGNTACVKALVAAASTNKVWGSAWVDSGVLGR